METLELQLSLFLTLAEAKKYSGLPESTLIELVRNDEIGTTRHGKIRKAHLDNWLMGFANRGSKREKFDYNEDFIKAYDSEYK